MQSKNPSPYTFTPIDRWIEERLNGDEGYSEGEQNQISKDHLADKRSVLSKENPKINEQIKRGIT